MTELIPEHVKPLALQAILFFTLAKAAGEDRSAAVKRFLDSEMCRRFGDRLTVANVYGFATAGGYDMIDPDILANEHFISLANEGHGWKITYRCKEVFEQGTLYNQCFDSLMRDWEDKLNELTN